MPYWRITPVADASDGRWQEDGPIWDEVIVRAPLPSTARVAAAEMESRYYPHDPIRNHARIEATAFPSAFFDEKLYHVERADIPQQEDVEADEVAVVLSRLRQT